MTQNTLLMIAAVILSLPLLGFVINIFIGKRIGRASGVIATSILGIDLLLSIFILYQKLTVYANEPCLQIKFPWVFLGKTTLSLGIGIDNLAAVMLIVVTLISFLVHLFSTEYMNGDKRYSRFYAYLGLFTFSMLGIVIANNFLCMYIFWELVGISSYLLIGFWYEKDSASNAGKKAFITNRIGDFGFLGGILIIFFTYHTFMYDEVFTAISHGIIPWGSGTWLTIAGILIFCGAIGKSAQFPLHVWLPDAMEGPTPVSALIHAATMVAAGVYLTARVFPMLTADALTFVAFIGAITAFMSATIALTQVDFKRVLAYSTVSQLGYMIMAIGVGSWTNGFFHLVTHAWFKAALFLSAGSVIHAMHQAAHHLGDHNTDVQDIRNMGGLRKTMPWTYFTCLFVTLAICGVPFTSGFLSKDGILAGTLAFAQLAGGIYWLIPIMGFAAAGMTAFYMFRLVILSFHGKPQTEIASHTKENKFVIVFPLVVLSFLSFWFFYSPNPTDAHVGWFAKALEAPRTVVPPQYQWNFINPFDRQNEIKVCDGNMMPTQCCGKHSQANNCQTAVCDKDKQAQGCCDKDKQNAQANACCDKDKQTQGCCDKDKQNAQANACCDKDKQTQGCCDKDKQNAQANACCDKDKQTQGCCDKDKQNAQANACCDKDKQIQGCCDKDKQNAQANACCDKDKQAQQMTCEGKCDKDKKQATACIGHKPEGQEAEYQNLYAEQSHHAHLPALILSILIAGCGILFSFCMYQFKIISADNLANQFRPLYDFSFNKWYFDELYSATFIGGSMLLSKLLALFDLKVIDGLVNLSATVIRGISYFVGHFDNIVIDGLVNLMASITGFCGALLRKTQTGHVQTYIVFAIIALMVILYYIV